MKFLYVVDLACFSPKFVYFFSHEFKQNLFSDSARGFKKEGVKKESQRSNTVLTDKFYLGKHFKSIEPKRGYTFALAVPVPWKGIFSPEVNVSAHLPAYVPSLSECPPVHM